MNQLKFLGKPAPEHQWCCGTGEYCNERAGDKDCPCEARIESLEGAIKEAAYLLETDNTMKWPLDTQKEFYKKSAITRKDFVAFLLRKTIGERT